MAALQRSIRSILSRAYSPKHLLATNTATFVSLLGLGDYIQQRFQGVEWDWRRTVRFASIGLILGPMNHYWYKFLDSRMAGRTLKEALKKAAVDFCVSPMFAISFIGGVAVLEGKSPKEALREYRSKFLHVLALDLCVWPPTQTINFLFVPKSARLLYISTVMLFYNTIVSYIKHREIEMYHDVLNKIRV
ncbi:hypothetical protein QR680_018496 [Steinernema hermaphroditum]|uniref:Mpv17-like protein 2 n=1 Tax=Steinernema hermaphroditum TaxID=289476 RepID=A0AA39LR71_9BILA|nr:hypothetical protein QR680_018496 [Steinernema hermaphroditum]